MSNNVNIIKYTKSYKYTEQFLATRTFSPSNGRQRMDTANTPSPAKHGDRGECREVMGSRHQEQDPSWVAAIEEESQSPAASCLGKVMSMVWNTLLINLDVNLGVVLSVPPSHQFAAAGGWLKKSLISLTEAKISVSPYILFIPTPKHS